MSINKYRTFLKVVELGSLTKAAEALGYTQSGVSHTIISLEKEFGFLLIARSRTGIELTSNGEKVLSSIREILKWEDHLKQEIASIHGIESGIVRVGTFTSVSVHWLPDILKQFRQDYPKIEIQLFEGDYREIENWISDNVIECGFLSLPSKSMIDVIPLHKDPLLILLPHGHPLNRNAPIPLEALREEPFIIQRKGSDDDIYRVLEHAPFKPRVVFSARDDYAIMAMVEKGLGISILPELVLRGQHWDIHKRQLERPTYRTLGIGVHSLEHVSPATKVFLDYVQNRFKTIE